MSMPFEAITAEALKLNAEEQADLVERLVASIESATPLHPEWEAEIARRVADLDSGKVEPIPGELVLAEMRSMIESYRKA